LFLDRVSKFPRIINIGEIALAAKQPPSAGASMTIQATATTFVLVDTPPAPDAAKAPAKAPVKK
jgi:Tfp pilus assembly protein PilO